MEVLDICLRSSNQLVSPSIFSLHIQPNYP